MNIRCGMVEDGRRSLQGAVFVLATLSQPIACSRLGEVLGLDLCATNMKLGTERICLSVFVFKHMTFIDCACLISHLKRAVSTCYESCWRSMNGGLATRVSDDSISLPRLQGFVGLRKTHHSRRRWLILMVSTTNPCVGMQRTVAMTWTIVEECC